jgi:tetratricopeptide (TPR) repeat protein
LARAEGPAPSKAEGSVEGTHARAKALAWQGAFGWRLGRHELGGELLRQSLALLEGPEFVHRDARSERAFAMFEMGLVIKESALEEARLLYEQSLALYRALGDHWSTAYVLEELGWLAWESAAYGEASRLFAESLAIRQSLEDRRGVARSLHATGLTAVYQGQFEEGERLLRECVALCREIGERPLLAEGLSGLTHPFVFFLGRFAEAYPLFDEAEAIYSDLGWRDRLALSNALRGWARMHQGQYDRARARAENALTIGGELGRRWWVSLVLTVLGGTALADGTRAEAHSLLEEAIAVHRETRRREDASVGLVVIGYVARALGELSQARQHLSKALRAGVETGVFGLLVSPLPGVALLLADQGEVERAVELYGLASRYPLVANSRWVEDVAGKHIAVVAATLPPEVVIAAQERGRARDLDGTVTELLVELGEEQGSS